MFLFILGGRTMRLAAFGILVASAWASSACAQSEIVADYPATGVQLGNGWDSFIGSKTTSACIVAASASDSGQRRWVTFSDIVDTSSLVNSLSVSADAKISSIMGGSGSASVSFSRTVSISTSNSNVGVNVWIIEGAQYAIPPSDVSRVNQDLATEAAKAASEGFKSPTSAQLTPVLLNQGAIQLKASYSKLARMHPLDFRRECGDAFVSMVRNGSGLIGVASASTHTESEHSDFKAAVHGSFGISQVSASVQSSMDHMQSEGRVSLDYTQVGGQGLPVATSLNAFKDLVVQIGQQAKPETAAPYQIALTKYSSIRGYPSGTESLDLISKMADQYFGLETIRRDLLDANAHPDLYVLDGSVTAAQVSTLETEVDASMAAVKIAVEKCAKKPKTCKYPAKVPVDDYDYRSRMPITKEAAGAWFQHLAAQKELADATDTLTRTPTQVQNGDHCVRFSFRVCQERSPSFEANPEYARVQGRIAKAQEQVNALSSAPTIDQRRFDILVSEVNLARCQQRDATCINAERLDKIKVTMIH